MRAVRFHLPEGVWTYPSLQREASQEEQSRCGRSNIGACGGKGRSIVSRWESPNLDASSSFSVRSLRKSLHAIVTSMAAFAIPSGRQTICMWHWGMRSTLHHSSGFEWSHSQVSYGWTTVPVSFAWVIWLWQQFVHGFSSSCTVCNKRFLTGSVFYQHRLIHRGERRYGCEECNKRFYRADALKNHLVSHKTTSKKHLRAENPHLIRFLTLNGAFTSWTSTFSASIPVRNPTHALSVARNFVNEVIVTSTSNAVIQTLYQFHPPREQESRHLDVEESRTIRVFTAKCQAPSQINLPSVREAKLYSFQTSYIAFWYFLMSLCWNSSQSSFMELLLLSFFPAETFLHAFHNSIFIPR